jgi:hypothetical protein
MKFRTFRNLVVAGAAALVVAMGAGCFALVSWLGPGDEPVPVAGPAPRPVPSTSKPIATLPAGEAVDDAPGLRPMDRMIVELLARPATSDKVKDAFPRERFKVNIYRDAPGPHWTRLKIDYDRDELDDEKWDLEGGQPAKRRVSTRDDNTYDVEYRWRGGQWVGKE